MLRTQPELRQLLQNGFVHDPQFQAREVHAQAIVRASPEGHLRVLLAVPFHAASAIIGTTVFYVNALSVLIPNGTYNPLEPHEIAAHKEETINSVRRLLGFAASSPEPKARSASRRKAKK